MHNPLLMGVGDTVKDLLHQFYGPVDNEWPLFFDEVPQRDPLHKFKHEVWFPLVFSSLIDGYDMRMLQFTDCFGFLHQAFCLFPL